MQNGTVYKTKGNVSIRNLGEEIMPYDPENDKVHVLNKTGALIWKLLDGKNNITEIKNALIETFSETPREEISRDADEIIFKLEAENLIV